MLSKFEDGASEPARASRIPNPRYWADAVLIASLVKLGRFEEAEAAKAVLLNRLPDFSPKKFREELPIEPILVLREAGLPEWFSNIPFHQLSDPVPEAIAGTIRRL